MNAPLEYDEILAWLREEDPQRLLSLWQMADETRRACVGDAVHLRGLVELSNHCARQCAYCGLRAGNTGLGRYRMTVEEVLAAAHQAVDFGYGTVVLQAGEDHALSARWIAQVVSRIKTETPLAVTLSLGERQPEELELWRGAGADRYLLRFETSDRVLFNVIHPGQGGRASDRVAILRQLKALGYETGSGIMVGLPGQTYESVARDICLFRELDLDMIGIGPFIPHTQTPLGNQELWPQFVRAQDQLLHPDCADQVPNTELMVYKAVALTRLVCPEANIPSTTALATINRQNGRELGLKRGANVLMPNLTPVKYRSLYQIYPAKACITETGTACNNCLRVRIGALGRHVGVGPGKRGPMRQAGVTTQRSPIAGNWKLPIVNLQLSISNSHQLAAGDKRAPRIPRQPGLPPGKEAGRGNARPPCPAYDT
jgi:biotin synthase